MILLAILLLLTGSGGFAEGKCNLSEVKAAAEVAENIIPIFKYMNPIVGIFDNDCRIDEILEVVHEISQKLDNLEILIRESVANIMAKLTENYLNYQITKTNQYKFKIEEEFKDMKTYSGDLEKFENITLRTYARKDLQETLREYHQQYFVNEGITEGTLFSQIAAFLKDKGNFEEKCDGRGVSVQQELIDYYQSIVSVEVKAIIVVHFKYYLLSNYFEIGSFTEEKNMFNSKNDHRKVEMESNFKKSLSTMTNLHFWHCYPGHIDDHTFLARVSQGVHFFEYDKISCNGELYDKEEFRMAIKNDPSHPSGFGLMYFSNAAICYSNENSERKYEWLGTNGGFFGQKTNCPTKVKNTEARNVKSFFALCDDENDSKAERRFSTDVVSADVVNNFVITGVRIRKTGKTVFLEVQQGKLLSLGDIDGSTISWKKSTGISNKYISVNHRTKVHINKVQESGGNYVLTQVNFASSNNELFVEMGLTKFNYSSGELLKERRTLSTRSNNFSEIPTKNLDKPNRSYGKHSVLENGFLSFSASDRTKDAAQSSVPYLEIGDVSIIEGSPLTGIGLHYKQSRGFGGFIGLSVRLYDHNKNIDDLIN